MQNLLKLHFGQKSKELTKSKKSWQKCKEVTLLKSGLRFFNLVALSIFAKKRLALFLDHLFRLIPSAESKETVVILGSFAFC